jgi:hypothetical protein
MRAVQLQQNGIDLRWFTKQRFPQSRSTGKAAKRIEFTEVPGPCVVLRKAVKEVRQKSRAVRKPEHGVAIFTGSEHLRHAGCNVLCPEPGNLFRRRGVNIKQEIDLQ